MARSFIVAALIAAFGLLPLAFLGCGGAGHGDHAHTYTCPMHPEVVKDKPGDCPKCNMKLVEKK